MHFDLASFIFGVAVMTVPAIYAVIDISRRWQERYSRLYAEYRKEKGLE